MTENEKKELNDIYHDLENSVDPYFIREAFNRISSNESIYSEEFLAKIRIIKSKINGRKKELQSEVSNEKLNCDLLSTAENSDAMPTDERMNCIIELYNNYKIGIFDINAIKAILKKFNYKPEEILNYLNDRNNYSILNKYLSFIELNNMINHLKIYLFLTSKKTYESYEFAILDFSKYKEISYKSIIKLREKILLSDDKIKRVFVRKNLITINKENIKYFIDIIIDTASNLNDLKELLAKLSKANKLDYLADEELTDLWDAIIDKINDISNLDKQNSFNREIMRTQPTIMDFMALLRIPNDYYKSILQGFRNNINPNDFQDRLTYKILRYLNKFSREGNEYIWRELCLNDYYFVKNSLITWTTTRYIPDYLLIELGEKILNNGFNLSKEDLKDLYFRYIVIIISYIDCNKNLDNSSLITYLEDFAIKTQDISIIYYLLNIAPFINKSKLIDVLELNYDFFKSSDTIAYLKRNFIDIVLNDNSNSHWTNLSIQRNIAVSYSTIIEAIMNNTEIQYAIKNAPNDIWLENLALILVYDFGDKSFSVNDFNANLDNIDLEINKLDKYQKDIYDRLLQKFAEEREKLNNHPMARTKEQLAITKEQQ